MTRDKAREIARDASMAGRHGVVVIRERLLDGGFAVISEAACPRLVGSGVLLTDDVLEVWRDGELKGDYHADPGGVSPDPEKPT